LFDFIVARPNKDVLNDTRMLEAFQEAENKREDCARKNNGLYYRLNKGQFTSKYSIVGLKGIIKKFMSKIG
jgi:hypothetical protein